MLSRVWNAWSALWWAWTLKLGATCLILSVRQMCSRYVGMRVCPDSPMFLSHPPSLPVPFGPDVNLNVLFSVLLEVYRLTCEDRD